MSNVESLMLLSGITIISGVSLWMLNKENTPKKKSPPKKKSRQRSPTPEWSPSPMKEEEIKTPLPTIRKSPPKVIPRAKTPPRSPRAKTPPRSPRAKTPPRSPRANTLKIIIPKTPRARSPIRQTHEPRVKFGKTPRPILKRTRRRLSDNSISSTNATINTEATDRNNL